MQHVQALRLTKDPSQEAIELAHEGSICPELPHEDIDEKKGQSITEGEKEGGE